MGVQQGVQKNILWWPRAAKTPPKRSSTWTSKIVIYGLQVDIPLGGPLAAPGRATVWAKILGRDFGQSVPGFWAELLGGAFGRSFWVEGVWIWAQMWGSHVGHVWGA